MQLDWPLHNIAFPGFGRIPLQHTVKDLRPEGFVAYDDTVYLNTQTSSQWDSLKHVGGPCSSCLDDSLWFRCHSDLTLCFSGVAKPRASTTTGGSTMSWLMSPTSGCTVGSYGPGH